MADDTYTKLFSSITESTVWGEPPTTRCVWVTLLAKADRDGVVHASVPGLARLANVTLEECERALATFYAPDPYSRTPDNDGRRIEAVDGGWRLINHAKYRNIRHGGDTAERKRQWDREHRPSGHARAKAKQSDGSPTQSDESPTSPTQAEAEADAAPKPSGAFNLDTPETPQAPGSRATRKRAPSTFTLEHFRAMLPGVTDRWLSAFIEVRKNKRAPLTEAAAEGIIEQAAQAGVPLQIAIKTCAEMNWQGFRATWYANLTNGAKGNARPEGSERPEQHGYVDHVHGVIAEGLAAARARAGGDAGTIDAEFSEVAG